MTIKEIKRQYKVESYDRGKLLILSHKTEDGKCYRNKFIVALDKVKTGEYRVQASKCPNSWSLHESISTSKWSLLKQFIDLRIKEYDFSSEFYNPLFRKGYMEEIAVNDHIINILGFKFINSQWGITSYEKLFTSAYNKGEYKIILNVDGLDILAQSKIGSSRTKNDEVNVNLSMRDGSWISLKCKRNPKEICEKIDSLIRPEILVLAKNLLDYSHILHTVPIDLAKNSTSGFNVITKKIKKELIQQLEEILKQLN